MSQENVEIVRRGFEAWSRQDYEVASGHFTPDVEIYVSERILNPAVYSGIDGAMRFRKEIAETWGEFHVEIEDMLSAGDEVVVLVRSTGQGRASGAQVDSRAAWVVAVSGQKISRLRLYRDRSQALEAVGLSQQAMSQENIELVRRGYAAFVGGDPSGVVSFLDPEIETHDFPEVPDTGVSRGREGFVALVENVVGEFDEFRLEPEEFTALDENHVLVMVRTLGRGKGSGVDVEARATHLWTIRDRKAVRLRLFGTRDEALEAARLSE